MEYLIGLCLVVLLVLLVIVLKPQTENISGFWVASEEFKDDANLDQQIFYFGEGDGYIYDGYLLICADNETLFNDTVKFKITPKGYFSKQYTFCTEQDTDVIPQTTTMTLYPEIGMMEIKCLATKKIIAKLFKDNQMSANVAIVPEE